MGEGGTEFLRETLSSIQPYKSVRASTTQERTDSRKELEDHMIAHRASNSPCASSQSGKPVSKGH